MPDKQKRNANQQLGIPVRRSQRIRDKTEEAIKIQKASESNRPRESTTQKRRTAPRAGARRAQQSTQKPKPRRIAKLTEQNLLRKSVGPKGRGRPRKYQSTFDWIPVGGEADSIREERSPAIPQFSRNRPIGIHPSVIDLNRQLNYNPLDADMVSSTHSNSRALQIAPAMQKKNRRGRPKGTGVGSIKAKGRYRDANWEAGSNVSSSATTVGPRNTGFDLILLNHNVSYNDARRNSSSAKAVFHTVENLILNASFPTSLDPPTSDHVSWKLDLSKSAKSNEAIFQRTVIMSILGRHRLHPLLDYECEAAWRNSVHMPHCKESASCSLREPKPDLAVSFRTDGLLPDECDLTDLIRLDVCSSICPEGMTLATSDRAFPFFIIESKGKLEKQENKVGHLQTLYSGAQALFNIFRCMKAADKLNAFYDDVKVFTALATPGQFCLRVHWPVRKTGLPKYLFSDIVVKSGETYTYPEVSRVVDNVVNRYGVETLYPILKDTLKTLIEKNQMEETEGTEETEVESGARSVQPSRKRRLNGHSSSSARSKRRRVER